MMGQAGPAILSGKTAIRDRSDPFNEAFAFSPEQYARLKALRPDLFDPQSHPQERVKLWKAFAQSSEGRAFRWR